MNVAFYAPMKPPADPTPSGDRRVARLIVDALERGGAAVSLASAFRTYDPGDPARQARLRALGHRLAARLLARYRRLPEAARPAVWFTYHLYHKAPDHLGPLVAADLQIPYVVAEASHAPKQAAGPWADGHRAAEAAIRAAHRIYGFNPVDRACLAPLVRAPEVLADLRPFIDTAPFRRSAAERAAARRRVAAEHGLDPAVPILLTVAMMRADQKLRSYAVLAEALGRFGARGWQMLVIGGGPAEPEVRAMMRRFGRRVAFAGAREGEALAEAYAAADIFAWPAVKEAFGMVFLEACAAGLPVVAGRSAGITGIVADGETGLVVPAGDATALAEGLRRLLGDPALSRAMGRNAARRTRRLNDIAPASAYLIEDLRDLISRQSQATG